MPTLETIAVLATFLSLILFIGAPFLFDAITSREMEKTEIEIDEFKEKQKKTTPLIYL